MSNVYQVLNKCTVKITDLNLPLEISLPHCDKTIFYDFIARTTFFSVALNFLQVIRFQQSICQVQKTFVFRQCVSIM